MFFQCMFPCRHMLTCSAQLCSAVAPTDLSCVQKPHGHAACVAMEIRTLRGCREAFVLLNGCKGLQNACGRPEMKDAWSGYDLFWERPVRVIFVFGKGRQIVQNKVVVWAFLGVDPLPWQTCSHYLSVLDTFVGKANGWCLQCWVYAVKTWCVPAKPRLLSLPVNNAFVFLAERKRKQLPLLSCAFGSCYLFCSKDFVKNILSRKICSVFWRCLLSLHVKGFSFGAFTKWMQKDSSDVFSFTLHSVLLM